MAFRVLFCSLLVLLVSLLHFATFASSRTSSVTATAAAGKALKEAEAEVIEDTVPEVEEKATEFNEEEFTWEYTEGEYYEVEDSFVAGLKSATRSDAEVSTVGDSEAKTAEKDDKADDMVI